MHPRPSGIALAILALVSIGVEPAAARITPEARRVVDAYVRATGGRKAFNADRTLRVRGSIAALGLRGRFEAWTQVPDRVMTSIELGSIRIRTGYDGVRAWRTDLDSRKVTVLDGKDRDAAIADAYFQHEMWARPDQGGGDVRLGSQSYANGRVLRALEVRPPRGEARRLWLDARSGLVVRMVSRRDQHEWSESMSDYRTLAGRLRALTTESGDPTVPASYQRLSVDSAWVEAGVDTQLFSPPESPLGARRWFKEDGVASFPFRYGTRHIWVRASLNGGPVADFLLDTGATYTSIDSVYAARIGLKPEGASLVQGMAGAGSASFAHVKSLELHGGNGDGVEVDGLRVAVIDVAADLEPMLWRETMGLIGSDVIGRFVLEIDYDRQILTLRDPRTFEYRGEGKAIPLAIVDGIPAIEATLDDDCKGTFLVDLGNSFNVNVHGSMVRKCRLFGTRRKQIELYGGGFAGAFSTTLCRLRTIQIGSFRWEEPIAALSLTTSGVAGSQEIAGNLGNGVLERFVCTFDYERRVLHLEPGRRYAEPDRFPRSGTTLVKLGDRVVAGGVTPGSAAEAAGLRPLDEVTAIDGKPILKFTPEQLDRLFIEGEVGTTHSITVRRDGVKSTLTLRLADVL
jgi:hypothetical protein